MDARDRRARAQYVGLPVRPATALNPRGSDVDHITVTTNPWWANEAVSAKVAEPFRSDGEFWTSLAASADAFLTLVAAAAVCAVLAATGAGAWSVVPFVVPAALLVRAVRVARSASRHNRGAFEDRRAWQEAERTAVAAGFIPVLSHRHHSARD
jgi:hypothetical protein